MTNRILLSVSLLLMIVTPLCFAQIQTVVWNIDNTDKIANYETEKLGDPVIIDTPDGKAVEFDGLDDGLIVESNLAAGMDEFTIEVVFKPYASTVPANKEQRFIHMQESNDRRILIETRLTDDNQWYLDTFIKNFSSSKALINEANTHPVDAWYHVALVYKNGTMSHYVNGVLEMTGQVQYEAMQSGQTSVGVRLNKVHWYKGAIKMLKATNRVLDPSEFITLQTSVGSNMQVPQEWKMVQNYPNPFNPETVISYSLAKPALVNLAVYNASGEMVSQLVNEYQTQENYNCHFNGLDLAGGMYLYRLQVGEASISKKMLLLK